jgi:hypothetical protein
VIERIDVSVVAPRIDVLADAAPRFDTRIEQFRFDLSTYAARVDLYSYQARFNLFEDFE